MKLEACLPENVLCVKSHDISVTKKSTSLKKYDNVLSDFDPNRLPDWVKKKIRTGNIGEAIAYIYLAFTSKLYTNVMKVAGTNDKAGYDITAENLNKKMYIEVKTTKCDIEDMTFYISRNELRASSKYGKDYVIFLVSINEKKTEGLFLYSVDEIYDSVQLNEYVSSTTNYLIVNEKFKVTVRDADIHSILDLSNEHRFVMGIIKESKVVKRGISLLYHTYKPRMHFGIEKQR